MERRNPHAEPNPYALTEEVVAIARLPNAAGVVVERDLDLLIDRIASDLVVQAKECVRQFGDFHLALSGGSTPEPLYRRLMYDPMFRSLPWRRTHLWIVDERRVPEDHVDSNYRLIRELIVDHADIPLEQVHPMPALEVDADEIYEQELRETLAWREKGQDRLDFVLLGLGADGHTASLFPFSEAIDEDERLICINSGGETPAGGRVTMTFPLINAARFIAVMVTGVKKAAAVSRLADGEEDRAALPIAGVCPVGGELHWYLDDDAASGILWNAAPDDESPSIES